MYARFEQTGLRAHLGTSSTGKRTPGGREGPEQGRGEGQGGMKGKVKVHGDAMSCAALWYTMLSYTVLESAL
eukprot:10228308-Heterocapsa_arctica.AAC.1